jgi:hypothetical protein
MKGKYIKFMEAKSVDSVCCENSENGLAKYG